MNDPVLKLLARAEIADCVHGYALAVRRGDPAAAAALFTEQGRFEVREADPRDFTAQRSRARADGRAAIEAYVRGSTAHARMLPMIHNLIVTLEESGDESGNESGRRATATSLMVGRAWPSDSEVSGEYADTLVYEGGRWAFAERIYTIYVAR